MKSSIEENFDILVKMLTVVILLLSGINSGVL